MYNITRIPHFIGNHSNLQMCLIQIRFLFYGTLHIFPIDRSNFTFNGKTHFIG